MKNIKRLFLSLTCLLMIFTSFASPILAEENPSTDATERNVTITCIDLDDGEKVIEEPTKFTLHPGESYDTRPITSRLKEKGYDLVDEVDLPTRIEFASIDPREEYTVRFVHGKRTEKNVEMETEYTRTIHYVLADTEEKVMDDTVQKKIFVQQGTVTTDLVTKQQTIDAVTSAYWKDYSDMYPADETELPWVEGYHTPAPAGAERAAEDGNIESTVKWVKKTEEELDHITLPVVFVDTDLDNPIDLADKAVEIEVIETKKASTAPVSAVLDELLTTEEGSEEVGKFLLADEEYILPEEISYTEAREIIETAENLKIELKHNIKNFDEIHNEMTTDRKITLNSESGKVIDEKTDSVSGYFHKNAWVQDFTADKTLSGGEEENTYIGQKLNAYTAPELNGYELPEPAEIEEYTVMEDGDASLKYEIYYKLIKYKLNYVPGEGVKPNPENPAQYTVEDKVELKPVEKVGYEFVGWKPVGKEIPEGSTGDKELVAEFKPIVYEIKYVLADGENAKENPATYTIEDKEIVLKAPTKKGYTFVQWKEGDKIPAGSHGEKTFTALWKAVEYKISYNLDGGTNGSNPDKYTIEQEVVLKDPTRAGYKFKGWKEGNKIAKGSTGDKTFTAQWEIANPPVNTGAGERAIVIAAISAIAIGSLAATLVAKKKKED